MDKENIFIEGDQIENLFSDDLNPFLKWGLTWLFIVGILLFMMTYFMRWPEVVKAPAVLTASQSPKAIVPQLQTKVNALYFANGSKVKRDEVLATLENPADLEEIDQLSILISKIDTIYQNSIEDVAQVPLDYYRLSNLGDIQSQYEQFLRAHTELKFVLSDVFLADKLRLLKLRVKSLNKMKLNLELQRDTKLKDYENSVRTYDKEKELFDNGSITAYDLSSFESTVLSKRLSLQNTKNAIIHNESQSNDILEQRIQLIQTIETQKNNFIQAFKNLKSSLSHWKNRYLLVSPCEGILSIPEPTQKDAIISPQAPALYVISENAIPIIRIILPQYNLNAVDTGKVVRVKLSAYPYEEFGVLEGRLVSVSKIPSEGKYAAKVQLPNGLSTSFNKEIEFINGMEGEAEIVLNDERLLVRLLRKIME